MFCGRCGSEMAEGARFCSACGAPSQAAAAAQQPVWTSSAADPLTRLQRPRNNRMVAGVCAGLAQHYRWELTWVRVATVLISVFSSGAGIIAYIVFWIVMPEEPWMLPSSVGTTTPVSPGVPPGV